MPTKKTSSAPASSAPKKAVELSIDRWPVEGYRRQHECYEQLIRRGFKPVGGSSKYTRGFLVGRIHDGPGSGNTFYVTIEVEYPVWEQRYSNEDFDRSQALAADLTDMDKHAGRKGMLRFKTAEKIVRAANRYA